MTKKTWVLIGIVIFVISASIGLNSFRNAQTAKQEAAKAAEPTNLNAAGGDPTLGTANTIMRDFHKSIGYSFTVVDKDHVTDFDPSLAVDIVQGGTLSATDTLRARTDMQITVFAEMEMAQSPNMIWMKSNDISDEFTALYNAGFIEKHEANGQTYFTMPDTMFTILLQGELEGKNYSDVGVAGLDKPIKIGFPNSSGGRTSAAQMLSCALNNCNMITPEEFDADSRYAAALATFYTNAGKQPLATYSVDYCINWLNPPSTPVTLAVFPESCYGVWRLSQTTDQARANGDSKGNVGVYITKTVVQHFNLIGISQPGADYINTIKDPANADNFAMAVTESTGMRGSGSSYLPPVSLATFIAPNEPYQAMEFPFTALTDKIKAVLGNLSK